MKNTNWKKNVKQSYNNNYSRPRQDDSYNWKLTGTSVEVRNDDVSGALRRLKKILERDDRQRELSKREFYEKPSRQRKRNKDTARSRWLREVDQRRRDGFWVDSQTSFDVTWMKTKRKRRKHVELAKKIQARGRQ